MEIMAITVATDEGGRTSEQPRQTWKWDGDGDGDNRYDGDAYATLCGHLYVSLLAGLLKAFEGLSKFAVSPMLHPGIVGTLDLALRREKLAGRCHVDNNGGLCQLLYCRSGCSGRVECRGVEVVCVRVRVYVWVVCV